MYKYSRWYQQNPQMKHTVIVSSVKKLKALAEKMKKLDEFAFDTETNTLRVYGENKDFRLVGISISWGAYNNYYIPVGHRRIEDSNNILPVATVRKYMKPIFENKDIRLIGHNIKFDMHVLARIGIIVKTDDLFDTMVASWLCDENSPNGLKENTLQKLGVPQTHFKEVMETVPNSIKKEFGLAANSKPTFDLVLVNDGAPYAMYDAFYTWCLYLGAQDELESENMLRIFERTYRKFLKTLFAMEECGVRVDLDKLHKMSKGVKEDKEDLLYKIYEIVGTEFNTNSNQQLQELIFGYQSMPAKPTRSEAANKVRNSKSYAAKFDLSDDDTFKMCVQKEYDSKIKDYEKKIAKLESSPLMRLSFNMRPLTVTASGAPQCNAAALLKMSRMEFKNKRKQECVEMCKLLLQYKKLEKLDTAFLEGLEVQLYDDGRAHPSFNIIGTDSGRLSCASPNLQQLPKADEDDKYQIRSLFVGSKYLADKKSGVWVSDYVPDDIDKSKYVVKQKKIVAGDYNNLEMRVLAHYSKDPNLMEMFLTGSDTHSSTAVNMFELDCDISEVKKKYPHLRQAAKVINFLLMYGGGAFTLYNNLKEDPWSPIDLGGQEYLEKYGVRKGEDVAQIYIDKYFETYHGVTDFMAKQKRFAHKNGYVQTLLRRKRRLPDINGHDFKKKAYCERLAVNSCIQGSAADITMSGQNRINDDLWFKTMGVNMILQIHDELVFECPDDLVDETIKRAKRYMEHPFGDTVELNLPMLTSWDSGDSYQDAK